MSAQAQTATATPDFIPADDSTPDFIPATSAPVTKVVAKPPDEGGPVARFVNRFTGLPAHDIAEHPNAYLNPFSHEYWAKGEEEAKEQIPVEQRRPAIPGAQTYHDIKNKNYAGAAGDIAQGVLTAGQLIGGGELEEVPVRPEPAWRTAPTEGTEVPSVINRQPYAQPGRAIPEAPPTAKPPRPAPAWKTSPTEGTPVESVINRQPVAQAPKPRPIPEAAPEVQTAAAPAPETTLAKPPARIVKQAAALGPNAKVLTQAESLGHAIPEAAPAAEAENPYPKGAASERYAAENPNIIKLWQQGAGFESPEVEDVGIRARAATEQQMGPLERGAGRAIPEMPPEIRYVPSTNEIRQSLPEVKARTRADMMEDRAIQQEQAAQLEEQGRRARSEQLRRDIAGSSTGVTKGDLVRGARTPQPIPEAAQDLAPEWQAELDRRIAAKKAKHPRP